MALDFACAPKVLESTPTKSARRTGRPIVPTVESVHERNSRRLFDEENGCRYLGGTFECGMVYSGICAVAAQWSGAESRRAQSPEEAVEGAEEVREGATQGGAQDVEDGAEEHEVSAETVLIACAVALGAKAPDLSDRHYTAKSGC